MVSSFGECGTIFFEPVLSAAKVIVRQAHDSQSKRRCNNLHLYNDVKNFWYLLHRRRTCDGGCASVRERSFCEICHDDFLKVSDPRKVSSCRTVRSFVANFRYVDCSSCSLDACPTVLATAACTLKTRSQRCVSSALALRPLLEISVRNRAFRRRSNVAHRRMRKRP
jgi:hypothetical protein